MKGEGWFVVVFLPSHLQSARASLLDGTNNQLGATSILSQAHVFGLSKGFPQAGRRVHQGDEECSGRVLLEKPGRGVGNSSLL